MKRWGPLLTALGLAVGVTGWWLYATIEPGPDASSACRLHALYTHHVQISGAMDGCGRVTQQLYGSLALLVVGAMLFIVGWFLTTTPHLRPTAERTDTDPRFLASALLLVPIALLAAVVFGWQHYQDSKARDELHRAQAALAKLQLPADLSAGGKGCISDASSRCMRSGKGPLELKEELTALLHGTAEVQCDPAQPRRPCGIFVRGNVGGYPALATAFTRVYDSRTESIPPGAPRMQVRTETSPFFYIIGSTVQISLMPEPE